MALELQSQAHAACRSCAPCFGITCRSNSSFALPSPGRRHRPQPCGDTRAHSAGTLGRIAGGGRAGAWRIPRRMPRRSGHIRGTRGEQSGSRHAAHRLGQASARSGRIREPLDLVMVGRPSMVTCPARVHILCPKPRHGRVSAKNRLLRRMRRSHHPGAQCRRRARHRAGRPADQEGTHRKRSTSIASRWPKPTTSSSSRTPTRPTRSLRSRSGAVPVGMSSLAGMGHGAAGGPGGAAIDPEDMFEVRLAAAAPMGTARHARLEHGPQG